MANYYLPRTFVILIFVSASILGCSPGLELEESVVIEDNSDRQELISYLNSRQVYYRVDGDSVWYRLSDKEAIQDAKKTVWPELNYLGHTAIFQSDSDAVEFASSLQSRGITSSTFETEDGFLVGWSREDDAEARLVYEGWRNR